MRRWGRALRDAVWADDPGPEDTALLAGLVVVVPFGWLLLLARPMRRVFRSR